MVIYKRFLAGVIAVDTDAHSFVFMSCKAKD
jgi:hypothetical protein